MNTIYYNPCKKIIQDPHGGMDDIKKKLIGCVGTAAIRMDEDALRILRALRFSANLNFNLEKNTQNALLKYSSQIKRIAKERILQEFSKVTNFNQFVSLIISTIPLNVFFDREFCKLYLNLLPFEESMIKKKLNQEEIQFMLFLQIKKIYRIERSSTDFILNHYPIYIKNMNLVSFIKLFLKNGPNFSNEGVSHKIAVSMKKQELAHNYTQFFIDYFHYKKFINKDFSVKSSSNELSLNTLIDEKFFGNNLIFIIKIKELLSMV